MMCYDSYRFRREAMPREKVDWFTITEDDVKRRESALRTALEEMDVPPLRLDTSDLKNLKWLNRNLAINNSRAPLFNTAAEILVWLLRWHHIGKFKTTS